MTNYTETLAKNIQNYRKQSGLTQNTIAEKLGISFQAVSKWESGLSSPDIALLPVLAEIVGVSTDELFGIAPQTENKGVSVESVPWGDDDTVRAVVFLGKKIINDLDDLSRFTFKLEGDIGNVECRCNLDCGNIQGNANAGCDIHCGDVTKSNGVLGIGGQATAGCDIYSGNINGGVVAGCNINCGNIGGAVNAGCSINCGNVDGDVNAGSNINCGNISGDIVSCAGQINCATIEGDVDCACDISCKTIKGNVDCKGNITYK